MISGRFAAGFAWAAAQAAALAASGDIVLQVEDFHGPWRRQTNIRGYLGRGFCTSNANPRVAASVMVGHADIPRAGRYYVWARGYTSPGGRRAFRLQVSGKLLRRTHAGDARGWFWRRAGEADLPAGRVEIIVRDADR